MKDQYNREIDYLRISITERCNFQCTYCVDGTLQQSTMLTVEEIEKYVKVFVSLGIKKVRITGGEPLVHPRFLEIIKSIARFDEIESIYITTNGLLLEQYVEVLQLYKVKGFNISIDSLQQQRFHLLAKVDGKDRVLHSIYKAIDLGYDIKMNVVLIKGINEDEYKDFVELSRENKLKVRFIELMPIGAAKKLEGIKIEELLSSLDSSAYCQVKQGSVGSGPATYYQLINGIGMFGFISPLSQCFCETCNRIRITSDGMIKACLHYKQILSLRDYKEEELQKVIRSVIYGKPERHYFLEEKNEDKYMNQIGG